MPKLTPLSSPLSARCSQLVTNKSQGKRGIRSCHRFASSSRCCCAATTRASPSARNSSLSSPTHTSTALTTKYPIVIRHSVVLERRRYFNTTAHRSTFSTISTRPSHRLKSVQRATPTTLSSMPLRARITNPAFSTSTPMSSSTSYPDFAPEPADDPDDVLFNAHYGARIIELNRPRKLNSLNGSMGRKIVRRLLEWAKSDMANLILISGAGPKAFCAGGDVAALAQLNREPGPAGKIRSQAYFGLEYRLDHLVATYPKPYIAYLDGITMGGGVGLSVHAPVRIATERTVFAMPETTIGFFPDVGGSFFLPRLDGYLGTYLALTSERLTGVNAFYAGIATHYIDSASLSSLTERLGRLDFGDEMHLESKLKLIDSTIAEYDTGLPFNQPMSPVLRGDIRKAIDRCFAHDTVEGIIQALKHESVVNSSEEVSVWAAQTLKTMSARSPTSLRVTLRQMQLGSRWSIAETFQREYTLAGNFMHRVDDFNEGVEARLIKKPPVTPQWQPSSLSDVTDSFINQLFDTPPPTTKADGVTNPHETPNGKLKLLDIMKEAPPVNIPVHGPIGTFTGVGDYKAYPFAHISGLPTESAIAEYIRGNSGVAAEQVVKEFQGRRRGGYTVGIGEKVREVLERCCERTADGLVQWNS